MPPITRPIATSSRTSTLLIIRPTIGIMMNGRQAARGEHHAGIDRSVSHQALGVGREQVGAAEQHETQHQHQDERHSRNRDCP